MSEKKFNPADHLIPLKGRDYLQVMWRLVWFREERPAWSIETEPIALDEKSAAFRAFIKDETGRIVQTGYGGETVRDFRDFAEKAETKAVGRALAMLGYGTQFTALELDETEGENGPRIVDSPVSSQPAQTAQKARRAAERPQAVNNPPQGAKPQETPQNAPEASLPADLPLSTGNKEFDKRIFRLWQTIMAAGDDANTVCAQAKVKDLSELKANQLAYLEQFYAMKGATA